MSPDPAWQNWLLGVVGYTLPIVGYIWDHWDDD
jgi:hypothetical protein